MDNLVIKSPGTVHDTRKPGGFFADSMFELQLLLLLLVLLYFFIPTQVITNHEALIAIMIGYAVFAMSSRYLDFQSSGIRWKLILETQGMIIFITAVLWHTGFVHSPLLNLYLLVIIACALALGKIMTMIELIIIAACYIYMAYVSYPADGIAPQTVTMLMAKFSPFLLVAYVTSMLASDMNSANRQIALLSQTDELTGLLNMRAFNLILEKETIRATRHRQAFTIVMIDVDNLKTVNDQYGHQAGSRLLKVIAGSMLDCVRTSDVLARYGGDEFVILMTQTSTDHARMVAERIRAAIHNTSFDMHGNRVATTVSIGIASFPDSVATASAVFEKADVALYKSKHEGRNRITFYGREIESIPHPV